MLCPKSSHAGQGTSLMHSHAGDAHALHVLRHIRMMVLVMMLVHVGIFLIFVSGAVELARIARYYKPYMDGPLSGESIEAVVTSAEQSVLAVGNITTTLASVTAAMSANFGFGNATAATAGRRHLASTTQLAVQPMSPVALLNSTRLQESLASLADALAASARQFNASAPSDFLHWIVQTNWAQELGPYAQQMFTLGRYGESIVGTVLGALGSRVDPAIVGPLNAYNVAARIAH